MNIPHFLSSPAPEDAVKYVHCILDTICANLTRRNVHEDAGLLSLLIRIENTFAYRHDNFFRALSGQELRGNLVLLTQFCSEHVMFL